jgi:ketosteroid isomerase-like protein
MRLRGVDPPRACLAHEHFRSSSDVLFRGASARTAVVPLVPARRAVWLALRDTGFAVLDEGMSVTRRWFETWNAGDLDAFIDLYAPDAQMTPPASWVEAGTIDGQPAIRRFFEGLKEAWEGEDAAILHEVFRVGNRVVSRMDWRVRGRASGINTHLAITNVNTIKDGRIVRQQHYLDHDEALEDLGLSESG